MLSSDQRKKQQTNNARIQITPPNYTTLLAVPTHIQHHPPIVTPNSHNRDTEARWDKSHTTSFGHSRILCSLFSCIHTCPPSTTAIVPAAESSPSAHLSHQHVQGVDDPRNVPQYGQQEVDPELHLHHPSMIHPSFTLTVQIRRRAQRH